MTATIDEEIARYLETGERDINCDAWPGNIVERGQRARADLRGALVSEVRRLAAGHQPPALAAGLDVVTVTRRKVEPMVRGLFPRGEQDRVLATLERSAVFLTAANVDDVLMTARWDKTAWDLANLYLASVGAELLGEDAPQIVGLSEETTFYVSLEYFDEDDPFADFVVHEAADVFHNCKRRTLGLPETRRREWLLDIHYPKRETFAYACEAYAKILERAPRPRDRGTLVSEFADDRAAPADDRVDREELIDIVREAATARNGWKRILGRCAPPPRQSRRRLDPRSA